jgi:LmbE family N-acetylglucosaminyl deacetylase
MTAHPLRLLGMFAHPDDETFCAGGTLAKAVAAGAEALVVSATRGQAGQIRDAAVATRRTLGQVREQELRLACRRLGVQHAVCLDLMDGALSEIDPSILTAEVVRIIREFRPDVLITFGPAGAYGHPDHIAVSAAATDAFALAGSYEHFPEQLAQGLSPHTPERLYYSHFGRNRLLLLEELAHWLVGLGNAFRAEKDFVRAMSFFARESTTLQYANDYVQVEWYPPGTCIVEQGEVGTSLYLILTGEVDVVREEPDGTRHTIDHKGAGQFFGELALVYRQVRMAHVIAVDDVTCLALSTSQPAAFQGRGAGARLVGPAERGAEQTTIEATTCTDVSDYVEAKMTAIAAHRTQYPIRPDMFPRPLLVKMLGREYFTRVHPAMELEAELHPRLRSTPEVSALAARVGAGE